MAKAAGKMVMQMTLAPGSEGNVKKMVHAARRQRPDGDAGRAVAGASSSPSRPEDAGGGGDDQGRRRIVQDEALPRQDAAGRHRSTSGSARACRRSGLVKIEVEQKSNPHDQGPASSSSCGRGEGREAADHQAGQAVRSGRAMQQMMGGLRRGAPPRRSARGQGGAPPAPPRRRRDEEVDRRGRGRRRMASGEPTEEPTPKRLEEARRRGEVAFSRDAAVRGGDDGRDRRAGDAGAGLDGAPARVLEGRVRGGSARRTAAPRRRC